MKRAVISGLIAIAVLTVLPLSMRAQGSGWFDPAWQDRSPITITNTAGSTLTNFQVNVTLNSGSFDFTKANSNGSDIRATASDGVTAIPFWIESWNATSQTASVWIQVPSVPTSGTTVYLYYGNTAATSASNGNATFLFFDDFKTPVQEPGYWTLGTAQTVLTQDQGWQTSAPHTLEVVAANVNGFTYAGYYGLQNCGSSVGVAFSNDLINWQEYTGGSGNPVLTNARWPSVVMVGSTIYMAYEKNYCSSSEVDLASSTDGVNWTFVEQLVPPSYLSNTSNQNPDLWLNPNDGHYYLFWYSGNDTNSYSIMARSATSPQGLNSNASEVRVLRANSTLAAPDIMYYGGAYYLSAETIDSGGLWNTWIYSSTTSPTSGFTLLPGNPVMNNGAACNMQFIVGTTLHDYYCQLTGSTWTVQHRQADLTQSRPNFPTFDPAKWTPTGGMWTYVTDTRPDGTTGNVLQGDPGGTEILQSLFSGTDYVLDAYGKQLSGRVWGLSYRANDVNDMYSLNLYDDLGGTNNLYNYFWYNNGNTSTLGNAAVGQVNANTWYRLSVRAHGGTFNIYKDGVSEMQTSSTTYASGPIGLYGEVNTIANYANVLVRQYASADPTASVGAQESLNVASVILNPTSVVAPGTSTGTVTLNSAPTKDTRVTLSSNNGAATLPATVVVSANTTSATFTISTIPVSSSTPVTITAGLNGSSSAVLTINTPVTTTVSLSPSAVIGGTPSTGTVTLSSEAPVGGAVVTLSSNNTAAASVPASVTIPENATSVTFTITTSPQGSVASPVITATYEGAQNATLTINPPTPAGVTLSPAQVAGGLSSSGTVTLSGPAPLGGAIIALSSDNTSVATVPANVTIAAGQRTSPAFVINTSAVGSPATANIGATYGSSTSTQLSVFPASGAGSLGLAAVSVTPTWTNGAQSTALVGTVTLGSPAPNGGVTVTLSSSNTSLITTDASVSVPAGSTTANFNAQANPVTGVASVTITGTFNGTQSTTVVLNPPSVPLIRMFDPTVEVPWVMDSNSTQPGEYGVRFYTDTDGYVLGVSFYKSTINTGTHVGNLWSASGQLLATATFTSETSSGWQTVYFSNPVHVTADTPYIASYFSPTGDYSYDDQYFALGFGVAATPLNFYGDTATTPNGVFMLSPVSAFPATRSAGSANYDVDVLFDSAPSALTITSLSLPDAYRGGYYSGQLTAQGGQAPYQWSLVSGTLPSGISMNAQGQLFGLENIPVNESYNTINFTVKVTDSAHNSVTAPVGIFVAPPQTCPCSLFLPSETPYDAIDTNATTPGEFGLHFYAETDGNITGIRFYKGPNNTGTHVGHLWTGSGQLLASVTFTGETASGWQEQDLPTPVHITANQDYVVSYYSPTGDYSLGTYYFGYGYGYANDPLIVNPDSPSAPNGVFTYGLTSAFPTSTFESSNYYADVVFDSTANTLLSSVSVSPAAVTGGMSATGTVTLSSSAPTGGEMVQLFTDEPSIVSTPAYVIVPAGATSATFPVTTTSGLGAWGYTIEAVADGVVSTNIQINPPDASSITVQPSTVNAGYSVLGTVTINVTSPAGGTPLLLSSDNPAVTVPANVTVPQGATAVTFGVSTSSVASATTAHISALANQANTCCNMPAPITVSTSVTVQPFALAIQSVTLNPATIKGGSPTAGTATLNGPAPFGGATVTLGSNNTTYATVPASVVVPAGASSANFSISTSTVTGNPIPVTISATMNGTQSAILSVTDPPPTSATVTVRPTLVTGGTSVTGTVTLNALATPGGIVVGLTSSSASATVPSSVTVPSGKTSVDFTVPTSPVASATNVTITENFNGTSSTQFTIDPPAIRSISLNPIIVIGGSANSTGTVTLNAPAPVGGISVAIRSSNTSAAVAPPSVAVVEGATTATFPVTTFAVASSTTARFTATLNGSASAVLTVNPPVGIIFPTLSKLTLSPSVVTHPNSSTGTVTLSAVAPAGGVVVKLQSSDTAVATVPATITVNPGAISAQFTVRTLAKAPGNGKITIRASMSGSPNASGTLTVK